MKNPKFMLAFFVSLLLVSMPSFAQMVMDGDSTDWQAEPVLIQGIDNVDGLFPGGEGGIGALVNDLVDVKQVKAVITSEKAYAFIRFWGGPAWPNDAEYIEGNEYEGIPIHRSRGYYHMMLDLDNDPTTGFNSFYYEAHFTPVGYLADQGIAGQDQLGGEIWFYWGGDYYRSAPHPDSGGIKNKGVKSIEYTWEEILNYESETDAGDMMYPAEAVIPDPDSAKGMSWQGMLTFTSDDTILALDTLRTIWAGHGWGYDFLEYGMETSVAKEHFQNYYQLDFFNVGDVIGLAPMIETPIDDWGVDVTTRGETVVQEPPPPPEPITTFEEDFEDPVDLAFWRPNTSTHDDGTPVFDVTQEEGALKVVMKQINFPDGQMYDWAKVNQVFDLSEAPYWSMKIKVEPGAMWGETEIDEVPFMGSPFSYDEVSDTQIRQHSNPTVNVADDGEWHDVWFDWSEPDEDQEQFPNDLTNITRLLLEVVNWPDPHTATFWIDDFKVGEAAAPPPPPPALEIVRAAHPPAIDGVQDGIWENTPWYRDFIVVPRDAEGAENDPSHQDAALSWRAMWDDDYLYLFVSANDDSFSNEGSNNHTDDSIELWLDGDNSKGTSYDGVNDLGFIWAWQPDNPLVFSPTSEGKISTFDNDAVLQGGQAITTGQGRGLRLEVAIPWAEIGVTPAADHLMGLEVDYNDSDTPGIQKNTKLKFFDLTDQTWQNPSLMGTVKLVDRVVDDFAEVWYADVPPVMDGEKDILPDELPTYVMNYYPAPQGADSLSGYFGDSAMEFQVMWDSSYVYYFIDVQDDRVFYEGSTSFWQNDCIEFVVDGDNSKGTGLDGVNDRGIHFLPTSGEGIDSLEVNAGPVFDESSIPYASKLTDTGIYLEFGLPIDSVGIKPTNGYMFGFDVDYDDSDTEGVDRDTKGKTYGSTDDTYNKPNMWGTGKLMGGPGAPVPAEPMKLMIDRTAAAPEIDAVFDSLWFNSRNYKMANVVSGAADDWWDSYGQFRVLFDNSNLYVYVQVHDDTINTVHANTYEQDCIELFFDGNNSKNALGEGEDPGWPPKTYDEDDAQLRFVFNKDPESALGNFDVTSVEVAFDTTAYGWDMELAIPWSGQPFRGTAGLDIGFEIALGDNDGENRESIRKWWAVDNDDSWKDPSVFGTAHFSDRQINDRRLGAVLPVPFTAYPVQVDGVEDYAWKDVASVYGNHQFAEYDSLVDRDDAELEWKVMWDYNKFYYFIMVSDDIYSRDNPTQNWTDDGIEMWIDADASHGTSYDGINDWGFNFLHDPDNVSEPITQSGAGPALTSVWTEEQIASIEQAGQFTEKGFTLELAFPMALLGIEPGDGTAIGLDLDYNDDDDGGAKDTKIKTYDPTDNSWQNPSLMGIARLVGSAIESEVEEEAAVVLTYDLSQNYPNPFNPTTTINFSLPEPGQVRLLVYDVLGREVARLIDGQVNAGSHSVNFDAARHSSGVYFYMLQTGEHVFTKKMMLLK